MCSFLLSFNKELKMYVYLASFSASYKVWFDLCFAKIFTKYLVFQSVCMHLTKVENFAFLIDRNIKCHLMSVVIISSAKDCLPKVI